MVWDRAVPLLVAGLLLAGCDDGATAPSAGIPAALEIVSGGDQEGVSGGLLPLPVVIAVTDEVGRPVADFAVGVEPTAGGGWVVDPAPRTNAGGRAEIGWYAGPHAGEAQRLTVSAGALRLEVEATTGAPEPGRPYFGHRDWVEYVPGTLPLVITAPHGGLLAPAEIPDRSGPGITTVTDSRTLEVAGELADALEKLTGERPHLVLLHLRRTKLDANRDIDEAALGHPLAERAWREFHHWTETALASVEDRSGTGFYVDLHGHGHALQVLELGYLLTAADLFRTDAALDEPWAVQKSSLRTLAETGGASHAELLRGPGSLGGLFGAEGYPAVPAPARPHPGGAPYFSGGYNTARHGCRDGGAVCGYQLELNWEGVRETPETRRAFAEAHARVMRTFLQETSGSAAPPVPRAHSGGIGAPIR